MSNSLTELPPKAIITGWDFSTSGVKVLAFDLKGNIVARANLTTDLWYGEPDKDNQLAEAGLRELNLAQLDGQARASVRLIARKLREKGRLQDWVAGGISATHHTSGRVNEDASQVRRAICWNDQTLAHYHAIGMKRLGGEAGVEKRIHGPWAVRYTLSHLVKDEECLPEAGWKQTHRILSHGSLAAGYLTGNFDATSISSAASTGLLDFDKRRWAPSMLEAIENPALRKLAQKQLPKIVDHFEPIGTLSEGLCLEAGLEEGVNPVIFPTSDDQQAGLVGGGAVDDGQLAIVLGTSAVVNSSSLSKPRDSSLDVMCLNWGPYLWMRCYSNGASLVRKLFGDTPDFESLNAKAEKVPAGCSGYRVLPFLDAEPSLGIDKPSYKWFPSEPADEAVRYRACLEAIAYLIAVGVRAHRDAGQKITQMTVSGGLARSPIMCRILATILAGEVDAEIKTLKSDEGPALGAAVTALAAMETHLRRQKKSGPDFTVADAVGKLVRYSGVAKPIPDLVETYRGELQKFEQELAKIRKKSAKARAR